MDSTIEAHSLSFLRIHVFKYAKQLDPQVLLPRVQSCLKVPYLADSDQPFEEDDTWRNKILPGKQVAVNFPSTLPLKPATAAQTNGTLVHCVFQVYIDIFEKVEGPADAVRNNERRPRINRERAIDYLNTRETRWQDAPLGKHPELGFLQVE